MITQPTTRATSSGANPLARRGERERDQRAGEARTGQHRQRDSARRHAVLFDRPGGRAHDDHRDESEHQPHQRHRLELRTGGQVEQQPAPHR